MPVEIEPSNIHATWSDGVCHRSQQMRTVKRLDLDLVPEHTIVLVLHIHHVVQIAFLSSKEHILL